MILCRHLTLSHVVRGALDDLTSGRCSVNNSFQVQQPVGHDKTGGMYSSHVAVWP